MSGLEVGIACTFTNYNLTLEEGGGGGGGGEHSTNQIWNAVTVSVLNLDPGCTSYAPYHKKKHDDPCESASVRPSPGSLAFQSR